MKITNEQLQSLSELRTSLIDTFNMNCVSHTDNKAKVNFSDIKKLDNLIEELLLAQKEEKIQRINSGILKAIQKNH